MQEQQTASDRLINATYDRYARYEKILNAARLPATLLGAAAAVVLVAFGLGPLLGMATQGIAMCSVVAGVAGAGAAFGTVDKYSDRFGLRMLALGGMRTERQMNRVQKAFTDSLPLSGTATKAFIKAMTGGIREKLHIGRPLSLKRKPGPQI